MASASDLILRVYKDLCDIGRNRALVSGDHKPDPKQMVTLEGQARSSAREMTTTAFDPEKNHYDRKRQDEADKLAVDIKKLEEDLEFAHSDCRKRRDALAEHGTCTSVPSFPILTIFFGILIIALSAAVTLHDFLFSDLNSSQAWLFSLSIGLAAGGFIATALVGAYKATSAQKTLRWLGLVGGVIFSIALGVLRMVGVHTTEGIVFAVAIILLELGIVLALEAIGRGLRTQYIKWSEWREEHERLDAIYKSAQAEVQRIQQEISRKEALYEEFLEEVFEREARSQIIGELEEVAVKAVIDGYHQGLAENEGRLRGRKKKS